MSEKIGMKWFNFFTKWRPWISFVFTLLIIINLMGYTEYRMAYFGNIFLFIGLIGTFINTILGLILFFRVKKQKANNFNFIKRILIFETIFMSYQSAISSNSQTIDELIVMGIIMLLITYFVYYKNSVKYFYKREEIFVKDNLTENKVERDENASEIKKEATIHKTVNFKNLSLVLGVIIAVLICYVVSVTTKENSNEIENNNSTITSKIPTEYLGTWVLDNDNVIIIYEDNYTYINAYENEQDISYGKAEYVSGLLKLTVTENNGSWTEEIINPIGKERIFWISESGKELYTRENITQIGGIETFYKK